MTNGGADASRTKAKTPAPKPRRKLSRRSAMAQLFGPRGWLLAAAFSATLRFSRAGFTTIRLTDQEGPILEGNNVTLECLVSYGENMSDFTFQKYSKWLRSWISLDQSHDLRCWFYDVAVSHDNGRLLLTISDIQSWHAGPYRCASLNATDNTTVSDVLDLQMEYLHKVFISQSNSWCGTVGDSITVLEGDSLQLQCSADASKAPLYEWIRQGDDWILPSGSLTLSKITQEQAGTYTCQAHHPTLPQLTKSKSIRLLVESTKRSFSFESVMSLSTPMLALAVALPAVLLLLLILIFAFLIPRHRAAVQKKMALEESGQRTPIYKGSLDSVPSVGGDTQPLVM
ncbi:basal cell adhesion molecule-like isoform X2 [Pantherophis guttatus]|uniref:Basal cell adhesion molecule-like isoform X2 n=1 Tax=Pantherophis guttatus TaxID=94885 RepID=A0ABM3ZNA6_PANGU|nr:basal cell adhesion molecule-like isoform X2 [Pantherophis guttatus]